MPDDVQAAAEAVKAAAKVKRPERYTSIPKKNFLSTGSTCLNLAFSGDIDGGVPKGLYAFYVGDSSAGKTMAAMSLLAEACMNPEFDDYRLIYDPSENGAHMNVAKFFGKKLAARLEPMFGTKEAPGVSSNLEEFYYYLLENLDRGPCVVVEDSMDALVPEEVEKNQLAKIVRKKGKRGDGDPPEAKAKGSMGVEKAKMNSQLMRKVSNKLAETGSILILLSQTRATIGYGAQFNPRTRSGGDALRFYNRLEVWLSPRDKVKKKVMGKDRVVGMVTRAKMTKNHLTGWENGSVDLVYTRGVGLDDLAGCVRYLILEGHWSGAAKPSKPKADDGKAKIPPKIVAPEFAFSGSTEELIAHVQETNQERKLRELVGQVWNTIESQSTPVRKKRYV